jgi:hypothetical protein
VATAVPEHIQRLMDSVVIEPRDLIVCPRCDGLHDAELNDQLEMVIRCGDETITLETD